NSSLVRVGRHIQATNAPREKPISRPPALVPPVSICKMSQPIRAYWETSFMAGVSPLAPAHFPELPPIAGVRLAAYAAGVRYHGRTDLMLAELAPGSTVAGVLTRSTMPGQPVIWCR